MNNPCGVCDIEQGALAYHDEAWCLEHDYIKECPPYQRYIGYQEGLAEAESRVKAREREIVEWIHNELTNAPEDDYYASPEFYHGKAVTLQALEDWLGRR